MTLMTPSMIATAGAAEDPELPWLRGLVAATIATEPSDRAARTLRRWRDDPDADEVPCASGSHATLELDAEVALAAGRETVIASLADGVIVLDREGQLIASSPGYPCTGSADELGVLASGRVGFADPVGAHARSMIILIATRGGHNEQVTWLALFRIGSGGRLVMTFSAVVEHRLATARRRGQVTLLPEALIYTRPGGASSLWTFDPVAGIYVQRDSDDDANERRGDRA